MSLLEEAKKIKTIRVGKREKSTAKHRKEIIELLFAFKNGEITTQQLCGALNLKSSAYYNKFGSILVAAFLHNEIDIKLK